uniref:Uncharacterized protein n=1 Tax=Triticum urartu TaxID=4572 RepID=A0A8R7PS60_TRIUA
MAAARVPTAMPPASSSSRCRPPPWRRRRPLRRGAALRRALARSVGPLVTVPLVRDLVFYFPQGHIEQVGSVEFSQCSHPGPPPPPVAGRRRGRHHHHHGTPALSRVVKHQSDTVCEILQMERLDPVSKREAKKASHKANVERRIKPAPPTSDQKEAEKRRLEERKQERYAIGLARVAKKHAAKSAKTTAEKEDKRRRKLARAARRANGASAAPAPQPAAAAAVPAPPTLLLAHIGVLLLECM